MSQRDNLVYIGHMIDTANKALRFVEGVSRDINYLMYTCIALK